MRKRAADRRKELLLAARNIMFTEGPGKLTMRNLANAVGISEPAVYRYFAKKEELILALISLMFDGWHDKLEALHAKTMPAPEKILRLGRLHFDHLTKHQFNPILLFGEASDPHQARIAEALREKGLRFAKTMSAMFAQGKEAGEFVMDLSVPSATMAVMGVLQGSLIRWTLQRSTRGLVKDLENAIKTILRGLVSRTEQGGTP